MDHDDIDEFLEYVNEVEKGVCKLIISERALDSVQFHGPGFNSKNKEASSSKFIFAPNLVYPIHIPHSFWKIVVFYLKRIRITRSFVLDEQKGISSNHNATFSNFLQCDGHAPLPKPIWYIH